MRINKRKELYHWVFLQGTQFILVPVTEKKLTLEHEHVCGEMVTGLVWDMLSLYCLWDIKLHMLFFSQLDMGRELRNTR